MFSIPIKSFLEKHGVPSSALPIYINLSFAIAKLICMPRINMGLWTSFSQLVKTKSDYSQHKTGLNLFLHEYLKQLDSSCHLMDQLNSHMKIKMQCMMAISLLKEAKELSNNIEMQLDYLILLENAFASNTAQEKKQIELLDFRIFEEKHKERLFYLNNISDKLFLNWYVREQNPRVCLRLDRSDFLCERQIYCQVHSRPGVIVNVKDHYKIDSIDE